MGWERRWDAGEGRVNVAELRREFGVDGPWCYPLTILDAHTRFLIGCEALLDPARFYEASRPKYPRKLTSPDRYPWHQYLRVTTSLVQEEHP